MHRHRHIRVIALVALAVLATVVLVASAAAADEEHGDWTVVHSNVTRTGETITVSGQLSIELGGSLRLSDCTLRFIGGTPDDVRIHVRLGSLVLEDSTLKMENAGLMLVDGWLELHGDTNLEHIDVLVRSRGTLVVKEAVMTLRGSWSSPVFNDPATIHVEGSASFTDSSVSLEYGFISSEGTLTFTRSTLEAIADYGKDYERYLERLRFDQGTVTLIDSTFSDLYLGIHSRATLTVEGCTLNASDLKLFAPWWHQNLEALVADCTLIDSDLTVVLQESGSESKGLDVLVEDTALEGGRVILDLNETYIGDLVLRNVTVQGFSGYGVVIRASGFNGDLLLEGLTVDGPRGIQVSEDYSGLRLLDSTIRAQRTALDFSGTTATIPATLENVTVTGEHGVWARNTALRLLDSDLLGAGVPVMGEEGAAISLVDCLLDEEDIQVRVAPGHRKATIRVDRHLDIGSVHWSVGGTIDEGVVLLYIFHENASTKLEVWPVGPGPGPLIRILEWSVDGQGGEDYLAFHDVEPNIVLSDHTFKPVEMLDPWDEGPFQLVFVDDVKPWVKLDPRVSLHLTDPSLLIWGTAGDVGTGIDTLEWSLWNSTGEYVTSGVVDKLVDGRWYATIEITANQQVVTLTPRDRAGMDDTFPLRPVQVDVPTPLLTIHHPDDNLVTNVSLIPVSGRVVWYAHRVEIHVVGYQEVMVVPVLRGSFATILRLRHEGLNQIVVTSFDPFDGSDTKWLSVRLDTIAPALWLGPLDETSTNYVSSSSLVITGRTDDPKATVTVKGQVVGLVGNNSFATTVSLLQGAQTIRVTAIDIAGNINLMNLRVVLDPTPPQLALLRPSQTPFWSREQVVEVELSVDEPLAMATVNEDPVQVVSGSIVHTANLGGGPHVLVFEAVDLAGNRATLSVMLFLDTHPPRLTVVSPKTGTVVNTTAVEIVVSTDEVGCSLSVDGKRVDTHEQANYRLEGTMYLPRGEGVRELVLTLTDRAGNSVTVVLELDIDTVIPWISLRGLANGTRVTTEPLLVKGTTEPGSREVWVNGQMATLAPDGKFSATIELEEGWQNIAVRVVDRAGNVGLKMIPVKVLSAPDVEVPVTVLAGATIILTMAALAVTTEIGRYSLLVWFLPLYTKLRKERILDQRTRGLIQGYVTANPGANYTIIRDNLDLADGTLTYHIQVLEREGYLYSIREGLFRCFYPHGVPPPKRGKLHISDTQADIVRIAKRIPGITVGEIATAMSRRPNVISYHLKLLKEGGLVRMEEDGRHVRVYAIESAVAMV